MAQTRTEKQEMAADYAAELARSQNAFLLDFKGLSVPQVTILRDRIREIGGSYRVVKNRLVLRAIEGQPMAELKEHFVGPTAVAFTADDPVGLAKVLTEFRKEAKCIELKGGLVEGSPVAAEQVEDIAKMPTRDELLAKLLYLLQSPITRLARGLSAIPRQLVIVLDQVSQSKS